jgi:SAM-dependent methyltransferase
VLGLDANPEMLAVARRKHAGIEWHAGRAESLPFADASFDAVVSQFALMFFDDRVAALREMARAAAGRPLPVAVCDALEHSPGYAALARCSIGCSARAFGDAFRAPFVLGDDGCRCASVCRCRDRPMRASCQRRAPCASRSIDALVSTERACAWTLGGLLDDTQFSLLRREAQGAIRAVRRQPAAGSHSRCRRSDRRNKEDKPFPGDRPEMAET